MDRNDSDSLAVLGAGAFGTALAVALAAAGRSVTLWARDPAQAAAMARDRVNARHLPGAMLPQGVAPTADLAQAARAGVLLLTVPTQSLRGLLVAGGAAMAGRMLVVCCKGIERGTGLLPAQVVDQVLPGARVAALTGPSFAADIAQGKPTALTLATTDPAGPRLQQLLATPALRPYLADDLPGAQLGGALKNVVAIGAGIVMGAGLGESARAALMTRGFAEMTRLAQARGARPATLFGLSGLGDLVLTCTSEQSRNFRHGRALGAGQAAEPGATVEGAATARAVVETAGDLDLPITRMVAALLDRALPLEQAVEALMARPLRREDGG